MIPEVATFHTYPEQDSYDIIGVTYDRVQFREEKPLFNDVAWEE